MNPARWMMVDQMLREKERRFVRRIARILGTDLDLAKDELPDEVEFGKAPQLIPLAGLLNPEVYQKFIQTEVSSEEASIPDAEYEKQVEQLEKAGLLTDLDLIGADIDKKVKEIKSKTPFD
jgi:hypothetical protein